MSMNDQDVGLYPTNRVTAVLETFDDAQALLKNFQELGYDEREITLACGPEGMKLVDPTGEYHGFLGRVTRLVQQLGDTQRDLDEYQAALGAGKFVVAVKVKEGFTKEQVADLIRTYHGHNLNYYGRWLIEDLSDER